MLWLAGEIVHYRSDLREEERLTVSAVALLETLPAGDELLGAYQWSALVHARRARPAQALEFCRRVLELAPADSYFRLLGLTWRGWARALLFDPACLEDDREAIRLGRQYGHVSLASALSQGAERFWLIEGPKAALAAYRESHELHTRRGDSQAWIPAAASLAPMFDLGLWDETLATASEWRHQAEAAGCLAYLEPPRAAVLCWRGALDAARRVLDPVLPQARKGVLEALVPTLAAAVTVSAANGNPAEILALIQEYEDALAAAAPASWYWGGSYLADVVRACLAVGELDRAQRLAATAEPALWRHQLELQSAKAVIAEATGDPAALQLYTQAAAGWQAYGHVLERGLALLGLGRCRERADNPAASLPLLASRAAFGRLGAITLLAEADSWLGDSRRRTS
jgi:hypothetical protein